MGRADGSGPGVDAYLFPTVIGGGLGDIAEVREAGHRLRRAGVPTHLYRSPGRRMDPRVERLFEGSRFPRVRSPTLTNPRAITVAPMWGVSAAPARDEPFGRGGEWDPERRRIEAAYGPGHVLHVSLEEFARTLTSREETVERYREGGRPFAEIRRHLATAAGRKEVDAYHLAYRKFRAFDRPDVLHLFATFHPSRRFAREYPEAVQTGPLWPVRPVRAAPIRPGPDRTWVWYASPATSARLRPGVELGLSRADPPIALRIRAPPRAGGSSVVAPDAGTVLAPGSWAKEVDAAELRIVTGSRTLLEALSDRVPFLYFNGILGSGRRQRRHRPEKVRALLGAWRSEGIRGSVVGDLEAFSRGRRVAEVVARAARDPTFRAAFRRRWRPSGLRPPFDEAGDLLVRVATEWGLSSDDAEGTVRAWRLARGRLDPPVRSRPAPGIRV